jgi:hypothetical protein
MEKNHFIWPCLTYLISSKQVGVMPLALLSGFLLLMSSHAKEYQDISYEVQMLVYIVLITIYKIKLPWFSITNVRHFEKLYYIRRDLLLLHHLYAPR